MPPTVTMVSAFYPDRPGGAEVGLDVLRRGLSDLGIDHRLYSLRTAAGGQTGVVPIPPLHLVPRQAKILGPPGLDAMIARTLRPTLMAAGPSLVHVQDTYSLPGTLRALRGTGIPVICTWPNNLGIPHRRFDMPAAIGAWLDRREAKVVGAASTGCSSVIAISHYIAGELIRAGVPREKVVTIYAVGAVESCDARPLPPFPPLRVLAVGRIQGHKGFDVVVRAAARLPRTGVEVSVAGDGPDLPRLRRLADRLGAAERIRFVGRVDPARISTLYDSSHVVVVPTRTPEPFGRVAVEAMSRGRAVVAAAHGGLPEIVRDGETGVLVPPSDADALAAALGALDRGTLELMGRNGAERCRQHFQVDRIAAQVAELYERRARAGG